MPFTLNELRKRLCEREGRTTGMNVKSRLMQHAPDEMGFEIRVLAEIVNHVTENQEKLFEEQMFVIAEEAHDWLRWHLRNLLRARPTLPPGA